MARRWERPRSRCRHQCRTFPSLEHLGNMRAWMSWWVYLASPPREGTSYLWWIRWWASLCPELMQLLWLTDAGNAKPPLNVTRLENPVGPTISWLPLDGTLHQHHYGRNPPFLCLLDWESQRRFSQTWGLCSSPAHLGYLGTIGVAKHFTSVAYHHETNRMTEEFTAAWGQWLRNRWQSIHTTGRKISSCCFLHTRGVGEAKQFGVTVVDSADKLQDSLREMLALAHENFAQAQLSHPFSIQNGTLDPCIRWKLFRGGQTCVT